MQHGPPIKTTLVLYPFSPEGEPVIPEVYKLEFNSGVSIRQILKENGDKINGIGENYGDSDMEILVHVKRDAPLDDPFSDGRTFIELRVLSDPLYVDYFPAR